MFSFKQIYFVIFILIVYKTQAKISDKRLCVDENCSVIITVGKTLLRYASPEENVLSFAPNEDVTVYSLGAGTRPELIGVEIKGKRGYINKNHFRETNRLKRPKLLVATDIAENKPKVTLADAGIEINPHPTQETFEVVDGTKIPLDVASFCTEAPIVNVVNEQSSEEITKPLESVPDNQNVKPIVSNEPTITNAEEKINVVHQQQELPNESDSKEHEESDDEDDDLDDIDEEDDNDDDDPIEEESLDAYKAAQNKNASENLASNEIPSDLANEAVQKNSDITNHTTEYTVNSEEAVVEGESKENFGSEGIQSGQNKENDNDNLVKSENLTNAAQVESITHNVTEDSEKSKLEVDILQKQPEVPETHIGGTPPIADVIQQESEATEIGNEAPEVAVNKNIFKSVVEGIGSYITKNAKENAMYKEEIDSLLGDSKESQPPKEHQSLPAPITEIPIYIEAIPPADFDFVTEDPSFKVNSQDVNSINEDSMNATEDTADPSQIFPNELPPVFKVPEEAAEIKVKENVGEDLFDEENDNNNGIPEENVQNQELVISESTIIEDNLVTTDLGELLQDSEGPPQNNEPVVSEDVSVSLEEDSTQFLNSEAVEQSKGEEMGSQGESSGGFFSNVMSLFGWGHNKESAKTIEESEEIIKEDSPSTVSSVFDPPQAQELIKDKDLNSTIHTPWSSQHPEEKLKVDKEFCDKESQDCPKYEEEKIELHHEELSRSTTVLGSEELQILLTEAFSSDLFLYLTTTALSVIFLIFGMVILDKCRREGPLIGRINKLERQLLTTVKENEMLQQKATLFVEEQTQSLVETVPNEVVVELNQKLAEMNQVKLELEEQIQALEKELDTSTEVGIELNKILSEMLNSSDGSDIIKENIEHMQKKLLEQQGTINRINDTLSLKETENHELRLEMEINNRKVTDLQSELDKMVEKILKIEEERDQQHSTLENEIVVYQTKCKESLNKEHALNSEMHALKQQLAKLQRVAEVKVKEYNILKTSLNEIKSVKNNKDAFKSLLEVSEIKAQLEQLKSENLKYSEQLTQEREVNVAYATKIENLTQEVSDLRTKYEKADKEKVETNTKLQVLNNYFKEKEDQMQKEISKYESLWAAKEGEATSTTERIRYMQEELQNYKAQNESLKQEIVNQEVELKSQISVLEKKGHENWVTNRQTERKLEEAKQEAAQLRNRLTLRERAIAEGHNQIRMQSPLQQNGELPISPPPIDPTQSPPPLFNPRDHLAKSPAIPGMPPPPFFPPPMGGTPFIPPPPLDGMMPPLGDMGGMPPHFMPPMPPGMYPGDHRPPPLGRMSSPPPVGGRYSPESTVYSDYDRYSRRSPSPPYDSEYGASPPPIRGYSPYQDRLRDDRREYQRPQARSNGRNSKGIHSSGSENDSLGKINKKPQRKV